MANWLYPHEPSCSHNFCVGDGVLGSMDVSVLSKNDY